MLLVRYKPDVSICTYIHCVCQCVEVVQGDVFSTVSPARHIMWLCQDYTYHLGRISLSKPPQLCFGIITHCLGVVWFLTACCVSLLLNLTLWFGLEGVREEQWECMCGVYFIALTFVKQEKSLQNDSTFKSNELWANPLQSILWFLFIRSLSKTYMVYRLAVALSKTLKYTHQHLLHSQDNCVQLSTHTQAHIQYR